ncbi:hypothetical protein H9P43_004694 [Blastocladiella emersonii ATCC 22665]|nr:hypothetical protein H9P43_004694 [Blastocladiella emersonii ATCC 22665]
MRAAAARAYTDDAGSVRAAKGSFAKREAAQEEQFFRKRESINAEKVEHLDEELKEHYGKDAEKAAEKKDE